MVTDRIPFKPILASKMVTTASTAVPLLATSQGVRSLLIMAKKVAGDNTGNVFIGDSTLDQGVKEGIELAPGDFLEFPLHDTKVIDLTDVYVDADTSGDGVVFIYSKIDPIIDGVLL